MHQLQTIIRAALEIPGAYPMARVSVQEAGRCLEQLAAYVQCEQQPFWKEAHTALQQAAKVLKKGDFPVSDREIDAIISEIPAAYADIGMRIGKTANIVESWAQSGKASQDWLLNRARHARDASEAFIMLSFLLEGAKGEGPKLRQQIANMHDALIVNRRGTLTPYRRSKLTHTLMPPTAEQAA